MLIEMREVQLENAADDRLVTLGGTFTWPFASGAYRHPPAACAAVARTSSSRKHLAETFALPRLAVEARCLI